MRPPETGRAAAAGAGAEERATKYKGVRKRRWGKWVSEIRLPHSRERIWLGSYDTPEKAARAFDAAMLCLRGRGAAGFNFPGDLPVIEAPSGRRFSPSEVQAAAARFANEAPREAPPAPPGGAHHQPDSPEVAVSEGTLTGESTGEELDWSSFLDSVWPTPTNSGPNVPDFAGAFGMMDDFSDQFFPAPGTISAPTDYMDENEAAGYGHTSSLWHF